MTSERVTLRDINSSVNRLEDKIIDELKDMQRKIDRLENEVDNVQAFQNKVLGIALVLSSFVSVAATYIWNKVTNQA